jgi:Domain of unknown function (DUF5615)
MASGGCLTAKRPVVPFFTDNDVEDCVGDFLRDSGHSVVRCREVMANDSADPVIAANCRENGLLLITHNVRHFRAIAQKYEARHGRVDTLCRLEMDCHQSITRQRIEQFLPIIEREWSERAERPAGLRISIDRSVFRIHR